VVIPALTTLCVLFFGLMLAYAWEARQYRKLCDESIATLERWGERCRVWRQRYFDAEAKLTQINEITTSASEDDDATDEN